MKVKEKASLFVWSHVNAMERAKASLIASVPLVQPGTAGGLARVVVEDHLGAGGDASARRSNSLKYDSTISLPSRNPLPIQKLKQGNSIFPRDPGKLFKGVNVYSP